MLGVDEWCAMNVDGVAHHGLHHFTDCGGPSHPRSGQRTVASPSVRKCYMRAGGEISGAERPFSAGLVYGQAGPRPIGVIAGSLVGPLSKRERAIETSLWLRSDVECVGGCDDGDGVTVAPDAFGVAQTRRNATSQDEGHREECCDG